MSDQSSATEIGAVLVVVLALVSMGVIALGFLVPQRLFGSTIGLVGFFIAGLTMIVCAGLANYYDLRGILADAFG